MKNRNIINAIIKELQNDRKPVTVPNVITRSLFSTGGTLAGQEQEILEAFDSHRERIAQQAEQYERNNPGGITGFAYGIMSNNFFNLNLKA